MEESKIICISCPKGCNVTVCHENGAISEIRGATCKAGQEYARNEFTAPVRVLTSTVSVEGGELPLLPVKTKTPIPKGKMFECMQRICGMKIKAPVKVGQVLCEDICGCGSDLIATRDLDAAEKYAF